MFAYKAHFLVGHHLARPLVCFVRVNKNVLYKFHRLFELQSKSRRGKQRTAISLKLFSFFSCLHSDAWIWVEKSSNASLAVPSLDLNLPVVISIRASVRLYNMIFLANKLKPQQDSLTTHQVERGI